MDVVETVDQPDGLVVPSAAQERNTCAKAMRGILRGDITQTRPFVVSLFNLFTIDMPDPNNRTEFVNHMVSRATAVLGDLHNIAWENNNFQPECHLKGEVETQEVSEGKRAQDSYVSAAMALIRLLHVSALLALGAAFSRYISPAALLSGALLHPTIIEKIGLTWCASLVLLSYFWGTHHTFLSLFIGVMSVNFAT